MIHRPVSTSLRHRLAGFLTVLGVISTVVLGFAPTASAQGYVPVSGAGSTWSFNAIDQWRKNVLQYGMRINFTGTGSTDGRNQFKAGQVDFAVSEIPYGLTDGAVDTPPPAGTYAYMPIVAGGTALMYNLKIGGKRVTNLRLSGEVVTKIFTGVITMWSDPAIKADNPALALPARKITPVVRSDGSGTTAQFTTWMAAEHGGLWNDYCRREGKSTPCGFTSQYPSKTGAVTGQNGSIGVSNYVRQPQSEGAITYVEYSYARAANFPVVRLLNKAKFYVEPTANAVAVALTKARINPADLTQDLSSVYTDPDPRTYPLSSYSYMILPTAVTGKFNTDKGKTLSDFAYYFLCEGQNQAETLGFSPLPVNLVRAGMDQVARIPGSTRQNKDITKCNNPTFSGGDDNRLAKIARMPDACAKQGPTQCTGAEGDPAGASGAGNGGGAAGPGAAQNGGGAAVPGAAAPGEAAPAAGPAPGEETVDPVTGERVRNSSQNASAVPVSVDLRDDDSTLLIVVAVVLLVGLVVAPPLTARLLRTRGGAR